MGLAAGCFIHRPLLGGDLFVLVRGVLGDNDPPGAIVASKNIERPPLVLARPAVAFGIDRNLPHVHRDDIRMQEGDALDVVERLKIAKQVREYGGGEGMDCRRTDDLAPECGCPYGLWRQQRDETVDVPEPLGLFDPGDERENGTDIAGWR